MDPPHSSRGSAAAEPTTGTGPSVLTRNRQDDRVLQTRDPPNVRMSPASKPDHPAEQNTRLSRSRNRKSLVARTGDENAPDTPNQQDPRSAHDSTTATLPKNSPNLDLQMAESADMLAEDQDVAFDEAPLYAILSEYDDLFTDIFMDSVYLDFTTHKMKEGFCTCV